jgi:hypothetical protein
MVSSPIERTASLRNEACMPSEVGALAREPFERACRDYTFDDLKRRAAFNQLDAGRLRHWIRAAQAVAAGTPRRP